MATRVVMESGNIEIEGNTQTVDGVQIIDSKEKATVAKDGKQWELHGYENLLGSEAPGFPKIRAINHYPIDRFPEPVKL